MSNFHGSSLPRWVRTYQQNSHWFEASKELLKILHNAREGGPLSKALAGLTAAGTLIDTMYPAASAWQVLRQRGYMDSDFCIGGFLCDLLLKSGLPMQVIPSGLTSKVIFWETEAGGIAAVYGGGKYNDGPYLRDGDTDYFIKVLREIVWGQGSDLMLTAIPDGDRYSWRGAGKFRLNTMNPPGLYIGKKQPQEFADRLARYGDSPRTVLLRGPTGIGKSVLARHIARIKGEDSRTLKIAASILKDCRFDEVLSFVKFFQPTVLLLDDLDLDSKKDSENFLTLLEALRAPECLVLATMMTPTNRDKKPEFGDWHFPGMRPDRIDEIWTFYLPDDEERADILALYFDEFGLKKPKKKAWKALVKATENLTGAYLMEVARRIAVHGWKEWETELENVRCASPKPVEGGVSSNLDIAKFAEALQCLPQEQLKKLDSQTLGEIIQRCSGTPPGDQA